MRIIVSFTSIFGRHTKYGHKQNILKLSVKSVTSKLWVLKIYGGQWFFISKSCFNFDGIIPYYINIIQPRPAD